MEGEIGLDDSTTRSKDKQYIRRLDMNYGTMVVKATNSRKKFGDYS